MAGSEFATLAEILKYLNINILRKYVIDRNDAIPHNLQDRNVALIVDCDAGRDII